MPAIRVLVVDDSVVVRRLLVEALSADSAIEVAGTAPDGSVALTKIPQLRPDLITLDVEMPVMSGLETLREIRRLYPKLPVIMFSTLTERGAATTLDALALGASDYVTKPQTHERARTDPRANPSGTHPKGQSPDSVSIEQGRKAGSRVYARVAPHARENSVPDAACRPCGHRMFHRRPQRSGRPLAVARERISGSHRDCAAHASIVHAASGRKAGSPGIGPHP